MQPKWSWSTLPWTSAVALAVIAGIAVVLLPQAAVLALTNPARFTGDNKIRIGELFGLWSEADPSSVTGAQSPGWLHWLLLTLVLAVSATLITAATSYARRLAKDPQRKPGLAPLKDVNRELATKQLVTKRGPQLRPMIDRNHLKPSDCGYRVGSFWGIDLWLRLEDPTIVIGPSRSGKGWMLVLNWILSAPGALITTSSKMDNAILTMAERERQGSKVWVFAPGVAGGEDLDHVLRWDPVKGCIDEETLVRRVKALIPGDSFAGGTSNGGHWDTLGQQLAGDLFHAAACGGFGVDKIWDWVTSPQKAMEAVRAIREHEHGLPEKARHLERVISTPPEQRASQWGVLPTVLAFLESATARKWMLPSEGEEIDLVDFILDRGTLYLVGDKQTTGGFVRIIDGLLAELDYVTKGIADASEGARLDPPVTYLLDEAGNFEYQGLYELITAGGGRGRVAIAVFQSKEQLAQWGAENAKTMWDAAVAKIILPGGSDEEELAKLSRLIGDVWMNRESYTWGGGHPSTQINREERAVLKPKEIRELEGGYGLLFYRNLKPVIARLTPFDENPAYKRCAVDAKRASAQIRQRSPFTRRLERRDKASRA